MKRIICSVFLTLFVCLLLVGCGNSNSKAAEKYVGIWYGYKVSSGGTDIVFKDYASIAKMELTCEFTSDGKYTLHYYVAGKEGDKYPQVGTYVMDGNKIILNESEGTGEIINDELVLSFSNGAVKQYFRANE